MTDRRSMKASDPNLDVQAGRGSTKFVTDIPERSLWIVVRGNITLTAPNTACQLRPGDVWISDMPVTALTARSFCMWLVVHGTEAAWDAVTVPFPPMEPFRATSQRLRATSMVLRKAWQTIRKAAESHDVADHIALAAQSMHNPLALCVLRCPGRTKEQRRNSFVRLMRGRKVLKDAFNPGDLESAARAANCSVHYFRVLFYRVFGETATAFLLRRRLNRARALLQTRSWPIGKIALHCGFSGQQRFHAMFLKHFGIPPGMYRRCPSRRVELGSTTTT